MTPLIRAVIVFTLTLLIGPVWAVDRLPITEMPQALPITISVDIPLAEAIDAPLIVSATRPSETLEPKTPRVIGQIADELTMLRGSNMLPVSALKWPRSERENFWSFYAARADQPLWYGGSAADERRMALIRRLLAAEEDGLAAADYPVPPLPQQGASSREIAEADLLLSASAVAYARDARGARIDLMRFSKWITPKINLPKPALVLSDLAGSADAGNQLLSYQPPHEGYRRLRARLAELRETTASLSEAATPAMPQTLKGRTTTSMVANVAPRPYDLIVNMERWRWLPSDLGSDHVFVNLPEFNLKLIRKGEVVHMTKTVVGKPDTPTPLFSAAINSLIINPSWHVPESIIRNEFLPKMAEDPTFAEKSGYQVTQNGEMISIRQPPGERNALGLVKFNLPNQHAVYLHDTPLRKLFANTDRAYSHGCVRVENPFTLAALVLANNAYSEEILKSYVGREERSIKLNDPLPVHLAYFTVSIDDAGQLHRFGDIYGYDGLVQTALKLESRRSYAALP